MKNNDVITLSAFSIIVILSGCALITPKPIVPVVAPPVSPVVAAVATVADSNAQLKASVAANVETARKSNAKQAVGPLTETVESELALAANRLNTTPDPAELLFGEQRARAIAEGKTDEARRMYADATKQASEEAKARATAEANLSQALTDAQLASAKFTKDLAELNAQNAKTISDLNDQHQKEIEAAHNEVMQDQVKWLNRAGVSAAGLGIIVLGLAIGFGGIVGVKAIGPLAGLLVIGSLFCFGLAQIVGQWWFKWAILGSFLIIIVLVGIWVYNRYHAGTLAEDTKEKADKLLSVSKKVIPILDQAYDDADAQAKTLLDKLIFSKLGAKMDQKDKDTVLDLKKGT